MTDVKIPDTYSGTILSELCSVGLSATVLISRRQDTTHAAIPTVIQLKSPAGDAGGLYTTPDVAV